MSFTAQVKDELSRVEAGSIWAKYAQLSAIMRVSGTLSYYGPGRYGLKVSTETGAVARTMIKLTHELFDLQTDLTVRRSVLHKTRNYLIEITGQEELEAALETLGILVPGHGLLSGAPVQLLRDDEARKAFLRGTFMAGGFVADPRGDFHLEVVASTERLARDVANLMKGFGVSARLNRRRGSYVVYLKSFDDVVAILKVMGTVRSSNAIEYVRGVKHKKDVANRQTNADMANIRRASRAGTDQALLVSRAERLIPPDEMPPALREFCMLRRANPELSLADLGDLCRPPASKSAVYHRLLRLRALVEERSSAARASQDNQEEPSEDSQGEP